MFLLQRITGVVTLIFIAFHVWQTRVQVFLSGAEVNYQMMEEILVNPLWFTFYAIGVLSTIFHFANGLWSFFVTWGIAQSPKAQRIATYVDRKSTRLNSSHVAISYAVFCLKKKKIN